MKVKKLLIYSIFIAVIATSFIYSNYLVKEKADKQVSNQGQASVVSLINSSSKNNETQLKNSIKEGIESGKDIDIKITKDFSAEEALKLTKDTIINYGYGGYISNFQYSIDNNNVHITINYNDGKSDAISKINAVNSKVKYIIAEIIKPGMSEFEKEKAIHDYVVNNTSYDNENYIRGTVPEDSYNAYGVFFNNIAVCEGYSEAVYRLLNEAGIENMVITGTASGVAHSWNLVKIEGEYYHLDATYDDPIGSLGNTLSYKYFNLTDEEISKDHNWDREAYYPSTKTEYSFSIID